MVPRCLTTHLLEMTAYYPAVTITGPRQSGKTSLVRALFPNASYINFEIPDVRLHAQRDPRGLLKQLSQPVILDEIQLVPELLSYLQPILDESLPGKFILTGSYKFSLHKAIRQSLAGRTAMLTLLPLSAHELEKAGVYQDLPTSLLKGGYPRVYAQNIPPVVAYRDYLATYIERDLRDILAVKDLAAFQRMLKLCAFRIGQLFNYDSLATDVGVSPNTIKQWLSVLEASYVIFRLAPWHTNLGKRLIKTPKLYFYDTGLACYLAGLASTERIEHDSLRGQLFENLVALEIIKSHFNSGQPADLYFLRDQHGHEVDFVLAAGMRLHGIEAKSSETLQPRFLDGFQYFERVAPGTFTHQSLVYSGEGGSSYQNVQLVNWRHCANISAPL